MRVDLAFTPPPRVSPEVTCLVVDVLRATSVMAVLFGRGLRALWPAASIEEGRALRAALQAEGGHDGLLLLGEENAVPPAGYDYGNSPIELERVPAPVEVVHATTNGTPALLACQEAALVLPAAPLNAGATVRFAMDAGRDVLIVTAGLYGERAADDTLAGGLLVERLARAGVEPGDAALFALEQYEAASRHFAEVLRETEHGQRLVALGFGDDVDRCAQPDLYEIAAALRIEDGRAVLRPLRKPGR